MKAKAIVLDNHDEIERAKLLAIKQPELQLGTVDLYFALQAISSAFLTREGDIKAIIAGCSYILVNEDEVRNKIFNYLESI